MTVYTVTPQGSITTLPKKSHFTRNLLLTLATVFIFIPLTACMIIGFGRAIADHTAAPATSITTPANTCEGDVKAFNDGWNTALYGDGTAK